jgi:hypothetical protein
VFGAACAAAALIALAAPETTDGLAARGGDWLRTHWRASLALLIGASFAIPLQLAYAVLDRFPNSGDEYAYLFQAAEFARGRLWAPAPPLGDTFVAYRTWIIDGRWISQYPPAWRRRIPT